MLKFLHNVLNRPTQGQAVPAREVRQAAGATLAALQHVHLVLDSLHGEGWSRKHPALVAQYLSAFAQTNLASELAKIRDILGAGTGAITVNLEHAS
jgi:hypothetical protein